MRESPKIGRETMITINNLSFKYKKKQIFRDFNLNIPEGESCLITGINGVGKSTLLRIMAGVLKPDEGEISYGDLLGKKPKQKIGFISDKLSIYESLTVNEMIKLHSSFYKINEFDQSLLAHLKISYDQIIKELSIGQRTILLLSLILSAKPELLLVDEVIHSLDAYLRKVFLEKVIELISERSITVVMVNVNFHDIENLLNRVILLKNGKIAVDEKIEDLKKKVKRISGEDTLDDLPVLSKTGNPEFPDIYIYPFSEDMRSKTKGNIIDLNLTEIITAFIGKEYA